MNSRHMHCPSCGAHCAVVATTRLPDGRSRRRYACDGPSEHRFTIHDAEPSKPRGYRVQAPPAHWPHPLLTEWRPSPTWGTLCE